MFTSRYLLDILLLYYAVWLHLISTSFSLCCVCSTRPVMFFFLLSFHLELGLYMPLCYWFLFCSEMECKAQIGKFRHNFPVHFTAIDFPVDYYPSLDCLMWVSLGFLPWVFRAMPGYIEVEIYDCSWFLKFAIMWLKDEIMFGNLVCNCFSFVLKMLRLGLKCFALCR